MRADPMAPEATGRPHGAVRCSARAKSTGVRCGQPVVMGATVCRWHGGSAPQVVAAGARRAARADAERLLAALVPVDAPPIGDVAAELTRLASELVVARTAAATMVARLDGLADPLTGMAAPELALWSRLVDQSSKLLGDMARLGIDARRQVLDEQTLTMATTVIRFSMSWAAQRMRAGASADEIEAGWPAVVGAELRRLDAEATR